MGEAESGSTAWERSKAPSLKREMQTKEINLSEEGRSGTLVRWERQRLRILVEWGRHKSRKPI